MKILCYTRVPKADSIYANRLAYSMHLAWENAEGEFVPFHYNEGILYAKATSRQDGSLCAKSLKSPWIFPAKDGWGVLAVRTESEGQMDKEDIGTVLVFKTKDLVRYEEAGLFRLGESYERGGIFEARCAYNEEKGLYDICWLTEDGTWKIGEGDLFGEAEIRRDTVSEYDEGEEPAIGKNAPALRYLEQIDGAVPGNVIEVSDEVSAYLQKKLSVPVCVDMKLSKAPASEAELADVKAVAAYSDGTVFERKIDWAPAENGKAVGTVHQESIPFPLVLRRADPCCTYWHGKYYYIATNDADGNNTLFIRGADTLEGLTTAEDILLLDNATYDNIQALLWAPEFHEIGGKFYIFFAALPIKMGKGWGSNFYHLVSRVMELKEGGDPLNREDWMEPRIVERKDGSRLTPAGEEISLDMTTFEYRGKIYAMWSQRRYVPVDQGAWLYVAEIDEKEPWKLLSDPVCVAKPEYGWENNHVFVLEGPYALKNEDQLFVTYSGALVDATYTVGMLKLKKDSDPLVAENWEKKNFPLLSSRSAGGEYGTGHNAYVTDENGVVWNFYHAKKGVKGPRSTGVRRVHFDIDGEPMLNVLEEYDLPKKFRQVEAEL